MKAGVAVAQSAVLDTRPRAHLTPPRGWLSDPNGLTLVGGTYHAFYQAFPERADWGPMHWGHASSTDLVHWTHHPIALSPDEDGMIFSGSVVNTAHAGDPDARLVAVFTRHSQGVEAQCLAESRDDGITWDRPRRAPVLEPPNGTTDFRDPAVFRWEGETGSWWVMVLAVGRHIEFYVSEDLARWKLSSRWQDSSSTKTLETPSLVPLLDGEGLSRWVLTVGRMEGGPESRTSTHYIVGTFDGRQYAADAGRQFQPVDVGPDFYAPQYFSHAARPVWMGWMGNWEWARRGRLHSWRGVMSLPREVTLEGAGRDAILRQRLAPQVWDRTVPIVVGGGGEVDLPVVDGALIVAFDTSEAPRGAVMLANDLGETVEARWDADADTFSVASARWLEADADALIADVHEGRFRVGASDRMTLVIDTCTFEIFARDGAVVASVCASPGTVWARAQLLGVPSDGVAAWKVR